MEGLSGWVRSIGSARMGSADPGWGQPAKAGRFRLTIHLRPPTSEGHNFFVRTLFWVFLDSMESPLNQDSNWMPVEGSGYWSWRERGDRAGRVGWLGRAACSCVTSNFGRS